MRKILFILFIGIPFFTNGQDLAFTASINKNPALQGERIRIEFSINAKGKDFRAPNFKNFRIISGPNPSTSSSYSFVNGQSQSQTTTTYTYMIIALKVGNLTIGSATINAKGKQYKSNPIAIKVVKNNAQQNNQNKKTNSKNSISKEQLFLSATVNKRKIYQGEQIVVTYKLSTRVDLASTDLKNNPALNGFWTEDIKVNSKFRREVIDGVPYNVATIKKALLTAQKSGKLQIDPMEIRTQVRVQNKKNRRDPFDPFGMFNQYSAIEKIVSSKSITITVEPLPTPKPAHFFGGVGNLKMEVEVNNKTIKANEAINFKITISGNGNLALLEPFDIVFSPDFEVYDPKVIDKTFSAKTHTAGKKTFEYLLIPRFEGNYEIPAISYAYFHPQTKSYKTIRSNKIPITVLKGDAEESGITTIINKEDVKLLNSDIRYIKTKTKLEKETAIFFRSTFFWILFLSPILLFVTLLIYLKIVSKNDKDSIFNKSRKATKIAQKRLKNAQKHLLSNEKELFFEDIEKSLWGYFADKFAVEVARLSKESIQHYFKKNAINEKTEKQFIGLLSDCEIARYTSSSMKNNKMNELLKSAQEIIIEVESQKK